MSHFPHFERQYVKLNAEDTMFGNEMAKTIKMKALNLIEVESVEGYYISNGNEFDDESDDGNEVIDEQGIDEGKLSFSN